ncbi:MAG: 50S ribosomal protein L22 [Anaerolineae bacterium]|nr:50S ribosomal protein L22 [Anaerolineae bacterium]
MQEIRAVAKHLPISPQKLRLVIDQVRNSYADEASIILRYMPHKGAALTRKLLESAIANAEENYEMNRQDLFITSIMADEGPRMKRYKAGARGRYKPRVKRTSHLIIVLEEREG